MTTICIKDDLHKMVKSKASELRAHNCDANINKVLDIAIRIGLDQMTVDNINKSDNNDKQR